MSIIRGYEIYDKFSVVTSNEYRVERTTYVYIVQLLKQAYSERERGEGAYNVYNVYVNCRGFDCSGIICVYY